MINLSVRFTLLALVLLTAACHNETTNTTAKTDTSHKVEAASVEVNKAQINPSDTVAYCAEPLETNEANATQTDSIAFEKYAVEVPSSFIKAPLDWDSNPSAKMFRTRIIDAYKANTIDFGGYYIGVVFGCGAGCISGFMIDVRDGKIYDAPLGEENSCFFEQDKAICRANSLLYISAICKEKQEDKTVYYKAYLWNEDQKQFNKIEKNDFLVPRLKSSKN